MSAFLRSTQGVKKARSEPIRLQRGGSNFLKNNPNLVAAVTAHPPGMFYFLKKRLTEASMSAQFACKTPKWMFACLVFVLWTFGDYCRAGQPVTTTTGSVKPVTTTKKTAVPQKQYFVSPTLGNDKNNDGHSQQKPLKTLKMAESKTAPGDTVFLMNGIYRNVGYGTGKTKSLHPVLTCVVFVIFL